jgi:hypothetical protein
VVDEQINLSPAYEIRFYKKYKYYMYWLKFKSFPISIRVINWLTYNNEVSNANIYIDCITFFCIINIYLHLLSDYKLTTTS